MIVTKQRILIDSSKPSPTDDVCESAPWTAGVTDVSLYQSGTFLLTKSQSIKYVLKGSVSKNRSARTKTNNKKEKEKQRKTTKEEKKF